MNCIKRMNERVNASKFGKFFQLEERGSNLTTEFIGSIATFLTMCYIIAVNPNILAESGGPCKHNFDVDEKDDIAYALCINEIKKQFITATAITSMIACFLMGIVANLPICMSCGMGINAYFTYTVVGYHGFGKVSYGTALACVLIEGLIFLFLAVTGIRFFIIKLVPEPVKLATPAGIGAFLAHLGLQTAEGLGVVVSDTATAVTLGGCPPDRRTPIEASYLSGPAYTCDINGGQMESRTTWLGIGGMVLMVILLTYRVRSSFVLGIGLVTIVSWFRFTDVTFFPDDFLGNEKFEYFKKVVSVEPLTDIMVQYDFNNLGKSDALVALFTMLYVDFLDCTGTLFAICSSMGLIDKEGNFPRSRAAFSVDAIGAIVGSIFGISPIVAYIESAAGVEVGSRTGLTAVFVGIYFFISIFFAPILASIPPWATGGALIIVGTLMARSLVNVRWENPAHAFVAFITVIVMPLTYSIAYGIIAGIVGWIVMKTIFQAMQLIFRIPDPSIIVDDTDADEEEDTEEDVDVSKPSNSALVLPRAVVDEKI